VQRGRRGQENAGGGVAKGEAHNTISGAEGKGKKTESPNGPSAAVEISS